jgi:nicotine blue oxidoreductase
VIDHDQRHGYRGPDGKLRRGHPVLFAPGLAAQAAEQATGEAGARPFLSAHPELVELVDCSDLSDGGDIDTPSDLGRLG